MNNNNNKNLQKSEINHFIKKNTVVAQSSINKFPLAGQLSQVESSQSIKTSPIKTHVLETKQYPQSIQKSTTHKTQKIKIGMHKKAVSLMGSSHTSQLSNIPHNNDHQNFLDYTKQSSNMANINSQKQSYIPSSQTSFNDYNSNHNLNNHNYGDIKMFPKVDNFIINDKNGSLLTAQQQQQVKQFQKMLHDSQVQQQNFDQLHNAQEMGVKSFDQRPPIAGQTILSNNQSQRLSIVSDTQQLQSQNPGYRSHANSFKAQQNQITMKHPPNKYIKQQTSASDSQQNLNYNMTGGSTQSSQLKSKKSLQYSHQRTFSDVPSAMNKGTIFNPSMTSQTTNRNFQELIRSVNGKEQMTDAFGNPLILQQAMTHDIYPIGITSTTTSIGNNNIQGQQFAAKTTIGSSRQSAQSQVIIDDREIMLQHYQGPNKDKAIDINHIYQGQLKDQFQKTKQALKLTQQQFGGPSRKVVQGTRLNGSANTQSYRLSNQHSIAGASMTKMTFQVPDPKQTPKLNVKSGKGSATQSQNVSSHGVRSTHNQTQLTSNQALLYSDKVKKQKALKTKNIDTSNGLNTVSNINFGQIPAGDVTIQSLQRSVGKTSSKTTNLGQGHKRSASDGNQALFQSLSNRGQVNPNQQSMNQYNLAMKHSQNPLQNINMSNTQSEILRQGGQYSKQQSLSKIQPSMQYQNIPRPSGNDYNILSSERGSYSQSQVTNVSSNVVINSHRKINALESKHIRHYSEQVGVGNVNLNSSQNHLFNQKQQMQISGSSATTTSGQTKQGNGINIPKQQQINKPELLKPINVVKNGNGNEMIIMDQGINSISSTVISKQSLRDLQNIQQINAADIKQNTFYKNNNASQTVLKPVEERIETQESVASDPSLTPRSRMNFKINKKVRLAFQKPYVPGQPVAFTTQTDFYKIGKVMGKGAFGKVNLAIHRLSNKFVALKSINKQFLSEEASKRKVMQEFNILRRTRHASIVRLYESFETQQHIVFVMEVCGSGDLLTYVRRRRKLKEDVAKHMFKQIVEGLRYCHSKNILHRDIKLDNILLTSEGDIKICDFGVSKLVKPGEIMTEQCGTPAYIAPEVFENKGYEGYASDVWSAGVVLYAMLYGTVPFKANNMTELQKQITKCQTTFKDEISQDAINLLKGILERDPSKRLKISEILKHTWMQDIPEKVSVFTDQEKEKVIQEFAYYNFKNDANNADGVGEIVHTDPFTEQMLNSTQNSLIKNASTKSVILAPFNSTRSHIDDNFHLNQSIQELLIDKKNIKFAAKVKEIDRQYEANNNAELDNGVYHQDSEEDKQDNNDKNEEQKKKDNGKSLETSFEKNDQDDEYGLNEDKVNKPKKQSEWQKLEKMVIDRQKTEEEEEEKEYQSNLQNKFNLLGSAQTLVLDDRIINDIERHGFPRNYIVNSLNNDDLNYVTTYYYLLTTQKEY